MAGFGLTAAQLESVFPFSFVFDQQLTVIQLGRSLRRLLPEMHTGDPLHHHLRIHRPSIEMQADEISSQIDALFVFEQPDGTVRLRGQLLKLDQVFCFLGSPWVADLAEMSSLGLCVSDFARHDPVLDHLVLLQTRDTALASAKQLANDLIAANTAAQAGNVAKAQFLAMVSHEMRTPLGAIVGFSELLRGHLVGTNALDHLSRIANNAESLQQMIEDMLSFSKLEAGQLNLRSGVFSPAALVRDVAEVFRRPAATRGLTLRVVPAMDLPACVRGDEQRIRRVLVNLVGNAVKYTDSGHITLRARVVKRGPGVVDVEYRVSDTGVGIPDAMLERVFERFVRLNTPGRAYVPGSGLGLGICRALALLMRGSLWVHSRLNEGSDFFLQLPHALAQRAPAAPPTPSTLSVLPAEDPPRNVATRETTRILITDDSRDQRALLRHYLRPRPNTELFFAENGLEALELIGQHRFSLLLLDMMMPVMDGVTAAKAIREREQDGDHLPIVAMTAFDLESVGPRFLGAGCDAILAKPYQLVDLMTVVEAHIRHS